MKETVFLNNDREMPLLGLGVYKLPDDVQAEAAVTSAISAGYRMIDTASVYKNRITKKSCHKSRCKPSVDSSFFGVRSAHEITCFRMFNTFHRKDLLPHELQIDRRAYSPVRSRCGRWC